MKRLTLPIMAVLSLAACATRPDAIRPAPVSHEQFLQLECPALATKMSDTRAELDKFSTMQDSKADSDAWGVFLLGVPFSKFSGDHEADIARLKGEVEAIDTAQGKNRCKPVY